ncbi:MAG: hypothetical protein AAGL49_04025 [Pseudomonadota bacterium]
MRSLLAAAGAAVLSLGVASAGEGGFVGNTVTVTVGDVVTSIYIAEDGTFTASDGSSGGWTFDGSTLCFDDMCGPFDGSKGPGDSWEDTSWEGDAPATLSIESGNAL